MNNFVIKLFYLTGTGNSLKIAKDLGDGLGRHELISIPEVMKENDEVIIEGDIIGFIFPVYFARLPVIMREFIERARFTGRPYIFAAANGGGLFGRTLKLFQRLLAAREQVLHAGFRILMPGNHPRLAVLNRKNEADLFQLAEQRAGDITEIVRAGLPFKKEISRGVFGSVLSFLLGYDIPYEYSTEHSLDSYFWLNENCVNCGTCVQVCPVGNIVQTKRRPEWQHRCINCFACYNLCPWKAIQVTCPWKIFQLESDLVQLPRYRHPELPKVSGLS